MAEYATMIVDGRGLVLSCRECGALVHHRTVHDAWHASIDQLLLELASANPQRDLRRS